MVQMSKLALPLDPIPSKSPSPVLVWISVILRPAQQLEKTEIAKMKFFNIFQSVSFDSCFFDLKFDLQTALKTLFQIKMQP